MAGYPVTGGYEFVTTEFKAAAYAINSPLVAGTAGDAGLVDLGTTPLTITESVLGIVSAVPASNTYGIDTISFWGVYLPAQVAV